jgi:hypothetical protein
MVGNIAAASDLAWQPNLISNCTVSPPGGLYLYAQNYREAVDAFMEALKLDPTSDEIKKELRQVHLICSLFSLHPAINHSWVHRSMGT